MKKIELATFVLLLLLISFAFAFSNPFVSDQPDETILTTGKVIGEPDPQELIVVQTEETPQIDYPRIGQVAVSEEDDGKKLKDYLKELTDPKVQTAEEVQKVAEVEEFQDFVVVAFENKYSNPLAPGTPIQFNTKFDEEYEGFFREEQTVIVTTKSFLDKLFSFLGIKD